MRIRFEFRKDDDARFISHLDMIRVFERSARRAGLQVTYSQGFNPHPKIAFGPALALGTVSEKEYVDISFDQEMHPEYCMRILGQKLPPGVSISAAEKVPDGAKALNALINRAEYAITCILKGQLSQQEADDFCKALLIKDELIVKKRTKKGIEDRDIRKGIFYLEGKINDGELVLRAALASGSQGSVRPEQVLGILVCMGLPVEEQPREIRRTGLFSCNGKNCLTPLQVLDPSLSRLLPL